MIDYIFSRMRASAWRAQCKIVGSILAKIGAKISQKSFVEWIDNMPISKISQKNCHQSGLKFLKLSSESRLVAELEKSQF